MARSLETLLPEDMIKQLQELKQLAAEENYFSYGTISDNLAVQAFGGYYISWFGSDPSKEEFDPSIDRQPHRSPILERIREEAWKGKRHLLLIENIHVPISLDMLVLTLGERRPSLFLRPWLMSTTSKDVYDESKEVAQFNRWWDSHLGPEYYHALPFDDLRAEDWAVLIKEALRDAAASICSTLQDKGDEDFWLHVAQHCLYYGILYHPRQGEGAPGHQASNISSVTSDELVRCWVAEDLIFSTATPTKMPAATIQKQKQSNYYRSAYEAGKLVMQALQEYSLLPIYSGSASTVGTSCCKETNSTSSSQQDVVTGVSKLAEDVPRLKQDELSTHAKSSQLRWVSFMNEDGRHVSWNWWPRKIEGDIMMTSLILRGCSNMSEVPFHTLLTPHLRVLDLSYTPINSLPPSFSNLLNLFLLSLRGCSQLGTLSPPPPLHSNKQTSPLAHLENLEVLDMNGVPLLELTEQDGSNKSNLHYLDLSGSKFTTLPPEFFSEMSSLEELLLGNCSNLKELPHSMAQLSNLLVLHVEGTQITSFPEHMFQKMQRLHTLRLINNMLLVSLPMSLSEAKGLEVLHLYNCISLKSLPRSLSETKGLEVLHLYNCISLKSLPRSLSEAKGLKELHICNCISLMLQTLWEILSFLENLYIQTWEGLEDIKILGHPSLRTFSLSGPWVRFLSLRGCSELKSVNFSDDLTALEAVDLSGTAIEEIPHNLPNLPQLSMLLLFGVPCFKRFPWHQLVCFPIIFYLDHCAYDDNKTPKMFCQQRTCGDEKKHEEKTTSTAQVNINDPRMFHSFNADAVNKLVKEGQFLKSFIIQVKPCSVRGKGPLSNKVELFTRIQRHSTYGDVQYSEAASIMPMMKLQPKQRHVEISSNNQYPNGLRHILSVTNSLFITDDNYVKCLTDLNYSLEMLEDCQLQHCHQMTVVFMMHSRGSKALPYLKTLQASCLQNLLSLVEPSDLSDSRLITLKLLKHIHLEHCPRLEKMFPCSLSLPTLETLVILFCSNLKTIFYKQPYYQVAPSPLPNIKSIYLQELPQLLHIHDDILFRFERPKLEKIFVRGCHSFQRLPLLKKEYLKSEVEVSGEREWWDRLQFKLPEQSDYYFHVPPPEFVSRKKHIIESYLR